MSIKDRDPIELFQAWYAEAHEKEPSIPDAVALATVSASGMPAVRMVLLKAVDAAGFVFYTNLHSAKSRDIQENSKASLCFHWKSLNKQVRVSGSVTQVTDEEADAYFATRHRTSQLGAYASRQSEIMESRFVLEKRVARYAARFGVSEIPRPEWWSGYRIAPEIIEFWEELPFRLHRRFRCVWDTDENAWRSDWLFP